MIRIENTLARRIFLDRHALLDTPTGPARGADLAALIHRLGFVQIDSINTVERAHHMILWARRQSYRPANLRPLLERERALFEHWTHDASAIPAEFLPYWRARFRREHPRLLAAYRSWQGEAFETHLPAVLAHVERHGPVKGGDLGDRDRGRAGGWWAWHPEKTALEFLWRTGALAVTRREGFTKFYDVADRVYPPGEAVSDAELVDFACTAALDRLGFATTGELAAFWRLATPDEAKDWGRRALASGAVTEVAVEGADGTVRRCLARPDLSDSARGLPEPPGRIRILSPFDPLLRDRNRAERLFGFDYRIEVFVPEHRRRYGYYVFPVLEGDRLIGRIDARARRAEGRLEVTAFFPEPGVRLGKGREDRLAAELDRLARLCGCDAVDHARDWRREAAAPPPGM